MIEEILELDQVSKYTNRIYSTETVKAAISKIPDGGLFVEANDQNSSESTVRFDLISHRATNFLVEDGYLKADIIEFDGVIAAKAMTDTRLVTVGSGKVDKKGNVTDYVITKLYYAKDDFDG